MEFVGREESIMGMHPRRREDQHQDHRHGGRNRQENETKELRKKSAGDGVEERIKS
jgi:hypothetical protein